MPVTNADSAAYWQAAKNNKLMLRRCNACGEVHFMPRYLCPTCWSEDLEWFEARGKGKVHSFSIIRRASSAAYATRVPYVVALIDLDEGPRMMSNIVGPDALDIAIGDAVTLEFEERGDAKLPQFARARG
ncbi:MAG: Zn-ribbon domain-containing OB-fold protein [Rhizobiales bacterium]|nr:Zn-ribbon domain-containing OB-fold protein [Hyphomicrobiales bacterium]